MDALLASVAAAGISGIVAFAIYVFHTLRADFTDLRSQFGDLRSEFGDMRDEMRRGFAEIRAELARIERLPR